MAYCSNQSLPVSYKKQNNLGHRGLSGQGFHAASGRNQRTQQKAPRKNKNPRTSFNKPVGHLIVSFSLLFLPISYILYPSSPSRLCSLPPLSRGTIHHSFLRLELWKRLDTTEEMENCLGTGFI
ncbi:hypothetical protein TNIN_1011 [Trichonephila inaurata madagascariensis]|uniref:Uncharacterized protein n=1 Tax=Trichonephila inaurata madagascariensis TaxID=2747483 RepID=A0A8X7BV94_9ARAC|nr:hypothetical protein TNIN_1011 [Trichonephila inaurata madagascariensis]